MFLMFLVSTLVYSLLLLTPDKLSISSMEASESQKTCPLTGNALPQDKLDVAVVFGVAVPSCTMQSCGHACTMGALVDVLQEHAGPVKCPACDKSFVISVCDALAAKQLCSTDTDDVHEPCDLIAFRYGQQVYWLAIMREKNSTITAQDRIAQVLGIDCENDLKILHHGKTVFPDADNTPGQVSSGLVDICRSEIGKKPSLIIMGKRTGHWGAQGGHIRR